MKITPPINQVDERCFFIPVWPIRSIFLCLMDENFYIPIRYTEFSPIVDIAQKGRAAVILNFAL